MAQKYRKIDPRIWDDEKFVAMSERNKLVTFNVLTGQSNRAGLFRFSMARASEQTAIQPDSYAIAFKEVVATLNWRFDQARNVLYIPTWFKYNAPENSKHFKGCLEDLHDSPQTPLLNEFASNEKYVPKHSVKVLRTFRKAMPIAMAYQELELEQEQKLEQKRLSANADVSSSEGEPSKSSTQGHGRAKGNRKASTGAHQELIRHFGQRWKARYGADRTFVQGKDAAHFKWILGKCEQNVAQACAIVNAYFQDEGDWIVGERHPLGVLVSRFDKYRISGPVQRDGNGDDGTFKPRAPDSTDITVFAGGEK